MREYSFVVPIRPKVKTRPRVLKNGHTYTEKATKIYESAVSQCYSGPKFDGQVEVSIVFKPTESVVTIRESDQVKSPLRGDVDNYGKAVLDALNGVAYDDDRQIAVLRLVKSG
jgi:Holliday junction resolvase RusA-like endonuclease